MTYTIPAKISKIEHKRRLARVVNNNMEYEVLGWFVQLDGCGESYWLGADKPDLEVGDEVDLVICKRMARDDVTTSA